MRTRHGSRKLTFTCSQGASGDGGLIPAQGRRDSLGWTKVVTERGRQPVSFSEVTQESLLKACSKDHMGRAQEKWTLIRELRFQAYPCEALSSWHVSTHWVQPKRLEGIAVITGQRFHEGNVEVALE